MLAGKSPTNFMIDGRFLDEARADFKNTFGTEEDILVKTELLNGEEIIVVENSKKRAFYSCEKGRTILKNVISLRGDL